MMQLQDGDIIEVFGKPYTVLDSHPDRANKVQIRRESDGYVDEIRRDQTQWPVVGNTKSAPQAVPQAAPVPPAPATGLQDGDIIEIFGKPYTVLDSHPDW